MEFFKRLQRTRPDYFFILAGGSFLVGFSLVVVISLLILQSRPEPTPSSVIVQIHTPTLAPTVILPTPTATSPSPTPSATNMASLTPLASVGPSLTPTNTIDPFIRHTVADGETITGIALGYGVSIETIVSANNLANPDALFIGQLLLIPVGPSEVSLIGTTPAGTTPMPTTVITGPLPTPTSQNITTVLLTPLSTAAAPAGWPPSLTAGDLAGNYPLTQLTSSGNILIHYQPGTYPAQNINSLAPDIERSFTNLQSQLNGQVGSAIDVYLGGTLFGDNPALQGFTQSYEYRTFILVNGAFHPGESNYIIAHELTHIVATHVLGAASSTMLHEGLATYLPQNYLTEDAGYLPIEQICAATLQTADFRPAVQLATLAYGANGFGGHIRTFLNYNLSGCFVGYLLNNYGLESLDALYDSGDYSGVYGQTLAELDAAWQVSLGQVAVTVDPAGFVNLVNQVAAAYESYLAASAGGVHANYEGYLHLNLARLAVNRGHLEQAQQELETFWTLFES